jgi:serine/threonine protein kinase
MAPEQIAGQPADERSDIFAFGCVLYELLSGRRAFPGETILASLAAAAVIEPKPLDGVPERLGRLVRSCLQKDPQRRLQHMNDARVELEELKLPGSGAATHVLRASRKPWRIAIPVLLGAVLAAAASTTARIGAIPKKAPGRSRTRTPLSSPISPTLRETTFSTTR